MISDAERVSSPMTASNLFTEGINLVADLIADLVGSVSDNSILALYSAIRNDDYIFVIEKESFSLALLRNKPCP